MNRKRFRQAEKARHRPTAQGPLINRQLRLEPLEDRRMLAVLTVNSALGVDDGDITNDTTTLVEAINFANNLAGPDTIHFDTQLSDQHIYTGLEDTVLTESLTIDASALANNVIIDASGNSRIFRITSSTGDYHFLGLTLTRGKTIGDNFPGGAIHSRTSGTLTLQESTITDSSTNGRNSHGGGIYAKGPLVLIDSIIANNSTHGDQARGGGLFAYTATLTNSNVDDNRTTGDYADGGGVAGTTLALNNSSITGNRTAGDRANGGGIYGRTLNIQGSTLSGNRTAGDYSRGGGLYGQSVIVNQSIVDTNRTAGYHALGGGIATDQILTLQNSTVSNNSTSGYNARGGGIWATGSGVTTIENSTISSNTTQGASALGGGVAARLLTLTQSTVSGNQTAGQQAHGAGVYTSDATTLSQATITNNHTLTATGGGLWNRQGNLTVLDTILAGNSAGGTSPDFRPGSGVLDVSYSLIGDSSGLAIDQLGTITAAPGNLLDQDPKLSLLADHGGPTQTHALLAGSPAIDTGNPSASANPSNFDQRSALFVRTFDDPSAPGMSSDMGAFERQTLAGFNLVVDTPNNKYDGNLSPGNLSLREAVGIANGSTGTDTIQFNPQLSGQVIFIDGTELKITESLTIDAMPLAANVTIDALYASRVLNITASTGDFALKGLNLIAGNAKLENTSPTDNRFSGGVIRSLTTGTLTLEQSSIQVGVVYGTYGRGGGIFASGDVVLTASTIETGWAPREGVGGGLFTLGNATLLQSTLSGNRAGLRGGGMYAAGDVIIEQSTISDNHTYNSGDGGGAFALGNVTVSHSTITQNRANRAGGIWTDLGSFSASNSIIADNIAYETSPELHIGGALAVDYSLIGNTAGTSIDGSTGLGNLLNQPAQLGPLHHHGGPTRTHTLLTGSPAIDSGNPSLLPTAGQFDQRGGPFLRVVDDPSTTGTGIDMGAYERQSLASSSFIVTTTSNELDYSNSSVSLREAVNTANGNPGPDTISFDPLLAGETILLDGTVLSIAAGIAVDASLLPQPVTVDADHRSRIFDILPFSTGNFTFNHVVLTHGQTPSNSRSTMSDDPPAGGAIRSQATGTLTAINSSVLNSSVIEIGNEIANASAMGGGIYSVGPVTLTNSRLSGNLAQGFYPNGGGMFALGPLTLENSLIENNSAIVTGTSNFGSGANGGGAYSASSITLHSSTVRNNRLIGADVRGGGLFSPGADIFATDSRIEDNLALGTPHAYGPRSLGGGLAASNVTISSSTISNNRLTGGEAYGGGIHAYFNLTISDSTVSGNSATGRHAGGGAIASRLNTTITETTIQNNSASGLASTYGGAIHSQADVLLTQSSVSNNQAVGGVSFWGGSQNKGGGIFARGNASLILSTVSQNSVQGGYSGTGGGISASTVQLLQSTITGNAASTISGGIDAWGADVDLSNSIVSANRANQVPSNLSMTGGGISTVNFSLVGTDLLPDLGANNVASDTPRLGPLSNNGGSTPTHALLPGSPAIDAANSTLLTDQRGLSLPADLPHVTNATEGNGSDMGAFEAQFTFSADFDSDGDVDGADFLTWQRGFGQSPALKSEGNSDDDTDVDASDLAVWQVTYGTTSSLPPIPAFQEPLSRDLALEAEPPLATNAPMLTKALSSTTFLQKPAVSSLMKVQLDHTDFMPASHHEAALNSLADLPATAAMDDDFLPTASEAPRETWLTDELAQLLLSEWP